MKKKLSTDLSKLTSIDEKIINKLLKVSSYIISNALYEAQLVGDNIAELDLGFGEILIKNDNKKVLTKFIPNTDLQYDLTGVVHGDKSTLKVNLEKSLSAKLSEIYKDII